MHGSKILPLTVVDCQGNTSFIEELEEEENLKDLNNRVR
jgi:hypothetical protein